jgi:hypothetical protein
MQEVNEKRLQNSSYRHDWWPQPPGFMFFSMVDLTLKRDSMYSLLPHLSPLNDHRTKSKIPRNN